MNYRIVSFALLFLWSSVSINAQVKDSIAAPFSEWNIRTNPFSFFGPMGGPHAGIEVNLDRKKSLYWVSEFGLLLLNNSYLFSPDPNEEITKGRLRGWETKQEIRYWLATDRNRRVGFLALDLGYLRGNIENGGWFGMGARDPAGLYPYFMYSSFKEKITEYKVAVKYAYKLYFSRKNYHHVEGFAGLGVINRTSEQDPAPGELIQPDNEEFFYNEQLGVRLYVPIGVRLVFRVAE